MLVLFSGVTFYKIEYFDCIRNVFPIRCVQRVSREIQLNIDGADIGDTGGIGDVSHSLAPSAET